MTLFPSIPPFSLYEISHFRELPLRLLRFRPEMLGSEKAIEARHFSGSGECYSPRTGLSC